MFGGIYLVFFISIKYCTIFIHLKLLFFKFSKVFICE